MDRRRCHTLLLALALAPAALAACASAAAPAPRALFLGLLFVIEDPGWAAIGAGMLGVVLIGPVPRIPVGTATASLADAPARPEFSRPVRRRGFSPRLRLVIPVGTAVPRPAEARPVWR